MLGCAGPTLIGTQLGHSFYHLFPTYLVHSSLLSRKKMPHFSYVSSVKDENFPAQLSSCPPDRSLASLQAPCWLNRGVFSGPRWHRLWKPHSQSRTSLLAFHSCVSPNEVMSECKRVLLPALAGE